jgi:hypothetical protein
MQANPVLDIWVWHKAESPFGVIIKNVAVFACPFLSRSRWLLPVFSYNIAVEPS